MVYLERGLVTAMALSSARDTIRKMEEVMEIAWKEFEDMYDEK